MRRRSSTQFQEFENYEDYRQVETERENAFLPLDRTAPDIEGVALIFWQIGRWLGMSADPLKQLPSYFHPEINSLPDIRAPRSVEIERSND